LSPPTSACSTSPSIGAEFLTNFDIYAAARQRGNKAVAKVGTATPMQRPDEHQLHHIA